MKKIKNSFYAVLITAVLAGCSGKQGDTGPQGPAGANGTANISSLTYTIYPGNWSIGSNNWPYVDLIASAITNSNSDEVIVDVSSYGNGDWFGVPNTNYLLVGDDMLCDYDYGVVRVQYSSTGGGGGSAPATTLYFKVTVIPPGIQVKYPNVNWKNTSEVMALPEIQAALNKP